MAKLAEVQNRGSFTTEKRLPLLEFFLQRRQPSLDRRSLDDGRAGHGMFREGFENVVHLLDRMDNQACKERIVTRDLVAFDKFRPFLNESLDKMQLTRQGPDSHHRPDLIADRTGIDVNGKATNDAGSLQPADALRHTGRRHPDKAGELAHRQASIGIQRGKNLRVRCIQSGFCVLKV